MKNLTTYIALISSLFISSLCLGQPIITNSPSPYLTVVAEGKANVNVISFIGSGDGCRYTVETTQTSGAIPLTASNNLNSANYGITWGHYSTGTITYHITGCTTSPSPNGDYSKTYPILNIPANVSGSTNLSCGVQTVSYSVPSVANANSYEWTIPSGWTVSGSSTSNSITLQTNIDGGGDVNVKAVNGDVKTSSNTISVSRPQLTTPSVSNYGTLQGVNSGGYFDRILCGTTTIEITGGNGTSYDWQTTGGVSANSTTSTASISASSDGTIKVYPVSACGSAVGTDNYALMNIKTGTPGTPTFLADGDGNSFVNMCAGNSKYLVVNSDRANSFNFQLLNGSASLLYYGGNTASFSASNTGTKPSLIIVMVRVVIQNTSM